jgi:hypothetical protein
MNAGMGWVWDKENWGSILGNAYVRIEGERNQRVWDKESGGCILTIASNGMLGWVKDGIRNVEEASSQMLMLDWRVRSKEEKPEDGIRRVEKAFSWMHPLKWRVEGMGNRVGEAVAEMLPSRWRDR